jgi:hypothetical protein
MSGGISTERLFALPCFEGLRLYRRYAANYPNLGANDLLSLIDEIEADAHTLDMEASVYLSTLVETQISLDGHEFYQACIKGVLIKHQPIWAKLMRQGRRRFVRRLDTNDQDVFAAAGLMDIPAPLNVVTWWDSVSGIARLISDHHKMEQGRAAEILTLEHERVRLASIGITKEPEWPGLDDNFAGYDVLSYDHGPSGMINRLIEVKSTTVSPLRFIITRNEWEKAKKAGASYIFHVWNMKPSKPVLHERSVADVEPHIPDDNGKGYWKNAEIPVLTH